ncbi:MAG: hypothetical protein J7M19_03210 [Planctomycetes bacterium]|nr:hypothetical protein [Planctomycetota bacterium]
MCRILCAAVILTVILAAGLSAEERERSSSGSEGIMPVNTMSKEGGFVRNWLLLGMFPNEPIKGAAPPAVTRSGFDTDYLEPLGGEKTAEISPDTIVGTPDGPVGPPVAVEADPSGRVCIDPLFDHTDNKLAYAFCRVESHRDEVFYGHFGSNDAAKVWINSEEVLTAWAEKRNSHIDQHTFAVKLRKGTNTVLVKSDNKDEDWDFLLSLLNKAGEQKRWHEEVEALAVKPAETVLPEKASAVRFEVEFQPHSLLYSPEVSVTLEAPDGRVLAQTAVEIGKEGEITIPADAGQVLFLKAVLNDFEGRSLKGMAGLLRGNIETIKADVLQRAAALENAGPSGMPTDVWQRHIAAAKYYEYFLKLPPAKDDYEVHIRGKRCASSTGIVPKLLEIVQALESGRDIMTNRRGAFRAVYISTADDSAQPYTLYVPENYDAGSAWPLVIHLHGMGGWASMPETFDWPRENLAAKVDGRGAGNGYENLAEDDILEVIADVKRYYNVDDSRIYVRGGSMGGMGTWHMASTYPDLFAAAASFCGSPGDNPIENLLHVPLWAFHDRVDWVVPIDLDRWGAKLLQEWGYPARMSESNGFGHNAAGGAAAAGHDYSAWLLRSRKPKAPPAIVYTTSSPERGRAYWIDIREFTDPARTATVRSRVETPNNLYLQMDNIDTLAVDLIPPLFEKDAPLEISVTNVLLRMAPPLPQRIFVHRTADGYEICTDDPLPKSAVRTYTMGSLSNLHRGEPILIVEGTQGEAGLVEAMAAFAGKMSGRTRSWRPMDMATIPVKRDVDVTDDDIRKRNLFLIGGPQNNAVAGRIAEGLPVVERDGKVVLDGKATYDLKGRGYTLYHYNPLAPKRLVYVVASADAAFYDLKNGAVNKALDNCLPLDFCLLDVKSQQVVREVSWDKRWKPAERFFKSPLLPSVFAGREALRDEMAVSMLRAANADFAVCREVADEDQDKPLYDTSQARWADFEASGVNNWPLVAADVSGEELLDIAATAHGSDRLVILPKMDKDSIHKQDTYRVCMRGGTLWTLTRTRKKNLQTIRFITRDWYNDLKKRLYGE